MTVGTIIEEFDDSVVGAFLSIPRLRLVDLNSKYRRRT